MFRCTIAMITTAIRTFTNYTSHDRDVVVEHCAANPDPYNFPGPDLTFNEKN
jgi:hypothetical protein